MPTVGDIVDREIVAGDDATWRQEVTEVAVDRTIVEALLAFFARGESAAIVWKYITAAADANGEIEDDGSTGTGILVFRLTGAETALIGSGWRNYIIRVKMDDDSEHTVIAGDHRGEKADVVPVQPTAP